MQSRIKGKFHFLIAITALIGAVLACTIDQSETRIEKGIYYFSINPKTILENIEHNETNAFSPLDAEPDYSSPPENDPVYWNQVNYLQIVEALHELVWKESLSDWYLLQMYYSLSCDQTHIGFQYGQFTFFKLLNINGNEKRVERFIEIDPAQNFARISETEHFPNLMDLKLMKITEIQINADNVLEIAENNGGTENRIAAKNVCGISVGFSQDDQKKYRDDWLVIYSPSIFIDLINITTGD